MTVGAAAARPLNELNRQPNLVQEFVKNNLVLISRARGSAARPRNKN
jgi:hypothetical protein